MNVWGLKFGPGGEMICQRRLVEKPNFGRTCSGGHGIALGGSRSRLVRNIAHTHGIGGFLVAFWRWSRREVVVGK